MTDTEKLQKIRAHCVAFLELASKRTAGKWTRPGWKDCVDMGDDEKDIYIGHTSNAAFIAACAGPAEAGWRATIAAIDAWFALNGCRPFCADSMDIDSHAENAISNLANSILSAWPDSLL